MKRILFFGFLLLYQYSFSQVNETKRAILKSDSILMSTIGARLFPYFSLSKGSYFTGRQRSSYVKTGNFIGKRKLSKSISQLHFLYHFNYPDIPGIRGGMWIVLDNKFQLKNELDFDFIPQFILEGKPSDFISIESADSIARSNFKAKGMEISLPELRYDDHLKKYIYIVTNKLTETTGIQGGEFEIIRINSLSGVVESLGSGYSGIRIR